MAALVIYKCCATCRYKCCKKKQSSKKLQRAALANLATALSPALHQRAITLQTQAGCKKLGLEEPEAVIVDKQPGSKVGTGRKLPLTPTRDQDKGYGVKEECVRSVSVAPTHTTTLPKDTSSPPPPPPPPYPSDTMGEDEDNMELCTALYSKISDINIINIP